jgi:hypothetical protein
VVDCLTEGNVRVWTWTVRERMWVLAGIPRTANRTGLLGPEDWMINGREIGIGVVLPDQGSQDEHRHFICS